jgi:hypothetical protein
MSPWVYLSSAISATTAQEDTPVSIRIQVSSATVKALHNRLQQAYLKDDVRLVRRTTVLIDLLVHLVSVGVLCGARSQGSNPWQTQIVALGGPLLSHFPLDPIA